ncbi:ABC transporter ATP-binding protein [Clostridium sp. AWRP]|uniref:ABC transporter ATP-binding protein n=1 Tax=Clostridium sp. AWRP TaxID=2212991 RepID=UPI000FD96B6E|nr:ABC transporter ATP-binding protein [Clostridium sp. AWRP]AZV56476.1 ABC transporter ATP-binding protein [Clostridium sp. AWRP]
MFRNIMDFAITLYKYLGKKLILNILLITLQSLLNGTGIVLLIPLLSVAGIMGSINSSNFLLKDIQKFFMSLPNSISLIIILMLFVLIISFTALLTRQTSILNTKITEEFSSHLRKELFKNVVHSKWDCISNKRFSDLTNTFTMEVSRISSATVQLLKIISQVITALVQIIVSFAISAPITIFALINGFIIFILTSSSLRNAKKLGTSLLFMNKELQLQITEQLNGIKEVKSYCIQDSQIKKFSDLVKKIQCNSINFSKIQSTPDTIYKIISAIIISLFFYSSIIIFKVAPSNLLIVLFIFGRLWPLFSSFQNSLQNLFIMIPSFNNLMEINKEFKDNSEVINLINDRVSFSLNDYLELRNISFKYSGKNNFSIKNISLKIPSRSFTAFIGKSGSGKTTLANIIMGLLIPQNGCILSDYKEITEENVLSWRKNLAYVPQDPFIFNDTIKENLIKFSPDATEKELSNALKLACADEFISKLPKGIDTIMGDRGIKLSGGERQRIVLARALLRNPNILILDEATSSLDIENELKIQQAIEGLQGKLTLIVIAHRLSTIKAADNIFVIEDGILKDQGNYEYVINKIIPQ